MRPPADNDRTLRPLGANEIPPNLSFYAIDPLYKPGVPLGWASTRIEETLNRGLDVIPDGERGMYLTWRLLKTDPANVRFDVYRSTAGGAATKLTKQPLHSTTDFLDAAAPRDKESTWWVTPVVEGRATSEAPQKVTLPGGLVGRPFHAIPRQRRCEERRSRGDRRLQRRRHLRLHRQAPVRARRSGTGGAERRIPTSSTRTTARRAHSCGASIWAGTSITASGSRRWSVRDLDGDGRAEVSLRSAPYAKTREEAFDGGKGFVLDGPEYIAVYDGITGKEIDKADWIERGKPTEWADYSGNRSSRHMLGVAYLDGKTPSLVVVRGTYGMMRVDAWTLKDRKLQKLWRWTNERAPFKYQGQGQHSIKTGDIDGDGFDEILNGSIAIDHDGRTMWSTGMGHGDRFYLSDIDPERKGLEIWYTLEDPHPQHGVSLWDALTGGLIFGTPEPTMDNQVAGGLAGDIDPAHPGMELWGDKYFFTANGRALEGPVPPQNELVWWDADALRELHSRAASRSGRARRSPRRRAASSTSRTSSATGARRSSPSPRARCASMRRRSRRPIAACA